MTRLSVVARVQEEGTYRTIEARGQVARALVALAEAGQLGVTAQEVSSWAYRFAAYCFDLRTRHQLEIRTDVEKHPYGWHGRHVLLTPVEIVSVEGNARVA